MSFIPRNNPFEGDHDRSHFSLYEDNNADQHEEHQSNRSELRAEIPDSQPDPYLPAEIPDSQPDRVYRQYLPFGDPDYSELSSQLPTRDQSDIHLGDAEAFEFGDYDLREEAAVDSRDYNLDNQENIDPRASLFENSRWEPIDDSIHEEAVSSSSSTDSEIQPGGTRLTERLKVRPCHHPSYSHHSAFDMHQVSQPQFYAV